MKKVYVLTIAVLIFTVSHSQTTLYSNNFTGASGTTDATTQTLATPYGTGTSASSTIIATNGTTTGSFTGNPNANWSITSLSSTVGSQSVSAPTSGSYTGASGGAYAVFSGSNYTASQYGGIIIGPINTTGYQNVTLNFGFAYSLQAANVRAAATGFSYGSLAAWTNSVAPSSSSLTSPRLIPTTNAQSGYSYTTYSFTPTSGSVTWQYVSITLPASASNISSLYITLGMSTSTVSGNLILAFDDLKVTGTLIPTRTYSGLLYKSVQNGNWNNTATWNTAANIAGPWAAAAKAPDYQDSTITISTGTTVQDTSVATNIQANQIIVNGTLQLGNGTNDGMLTLGDDQTGDELTITNGGVLQITNVTQTSPFNFNTGTTLHVNSGGKILIGDGSSTIYQVCTSVAQTSVDNGFVIFDDNSIWEHNTPNKPASDGNYFGISSSTIPILRILQTPNGNLGNANTYKINGSLVLGSGVTLTYTGAGSKTFVSGISGAGTITSLSSSPSGSFKTGTTSTIISSGVTIQMNNTSTYLSVLSTDFTNNGNIVGARTSFDAGSQNIHGSGTYDSLTINNLGGLTIDANGGNTIKINKVLTLKAGILTTNGNLSLLTSSSGSATVATIDGAINTGSITGNVTVQRYINNSAAWRMIGFPLSSSTTISASALSTLYGSGYNAYTYNETLDNGAYNGSGGVNAGWTSFTSSATTTADKGILMIGGTPTSTLSATGTLNTGTQTITLSSTSGKGWNLIANPFASNITWSTVQAASTNVDATVYRYDPNTSAYASYNATTTSQTGSGQNNIIENGAGFFVHVTTPGSAASLSVAETAKTSTAPASSLMGVQTPSNKSIIKLSLSKQGDQYADEVVLRWGGGFAATDNFDGNFDAYDLGRAVGPDLSVIGTDKTVYSIFHGAELKNSSDENRTVQLGMKNMAEGTYQIGIQLQSPIANGNKAYLYDSYTGTYTLIDDNTSNYSFITTSDTKSQSSTRFSVVMNAKQIATVINDNSNLPVILLNNPSTGNIFTLYSKNNYNQLQWQVIDGGGRVMQTGQINSVMKGSTHQINAGNTATGNYFIKLNGDGNALPVLKAIKN